MCVLIFSQELTEIAVFAAFKLSHFLIAIVDMGVLAFPEVFTGFNAGTQLASLPPWILELFV